MLQSWLTQIWFHYITFQVVVFPDLDSVSSLRCRRQHMLQTFKRNTEPTRTKIKYALLTHYLQADYRSLTSASLVQKT